MASSGRGSGGRSGATLVCRWASAAARPSWASLCATTIIVAGAAIVVVVRHHSALLRRRRQDASDAGVDFVCSARISFDEPSRYGPDVRSSLPKQSTLPVSTVRDRRRGAAENAATSGGLPISPAASTACAAPVSMCRSITCRFPVGPFAMWDVAVQSISDWKNGYVPECDGCAVRLRCAGFFSSRRPRFSRGIKASAAPNLDPIVGRGIP